MASRISMKQWRDSQLADAEAQLEKYFEKDRRAALRRQAMERDFAEYQAWLEAKRAGEIDVDEGAWDESDEDSLPVDPATVSRADLYPFRLPDGMRTVRRGAFDFSDARPLADERGECIGGARPLYTDAEARRAELAALTGRIRIPSVPHLSARRKLDSIRTSSMRRARSAVPFVRDADGRAVLFTSDRAPAALRNNYQAAMDWNFDNQRRRSRRTLSRAAFYKSCSGQR